MYKRSKRADNIVEMIVITIAVVVVLNLVLGKVYDNFKDTIANSKYSKLFRSNQTSFEPSSGVNYSSPDSQINVPLVGEQGLTRYANGAVRTINELWEPSNRQNLLDNTIAQINFAEALTVLCEMRYHSAVLGSPPSAEELSGSSPCINRQYGALIITLSTTGAKTQIASTSASPGLDFPYGSCLNFLPKNISDENGKIEYISCVKSYFHKSR